MTAAATPRRRFPVPVLEGMLPVGKGRLPTEVIAGVTLAALAIPEVMGYAKIAGMPVITGLYTILIPIAVFAILGSSRHLVVGADSATAAIIAAALAQLATQGSPQYVALAGMLAVTAGGFLLLARILRLGFLANFLSRTVLIGFLTGVGIQVACGQFSGLFGIAKTEHGPIIQVVDTFKDLGSLSLATFAVSAAVLVVIVAGGRLAPKVPWALIAVVGAIIASAALSLSSHGVATLGTIPSGLPRVAWPSIPAGDYVKLVGTAASIFVVILAQSAATSRAYAAKFDDEFDENVDLVGLGMANISAALTGTFAVNGSPTKTAMVDTAGGRSQLAQLSTAAIVLVVILFLTKPLSYMPEAVLAAVVFLIGVELVDVRGMRTIYRLRPVEFAVALVTAAIVVLVGVEQGIILAIVLAIVAHLRHSYNPYDRLLVPGHKKEWKSTPLADGRQAAPGLLMYRFGASLYYANASRFAEEVRVLVDGAEPPALWLCVAAETMDDLDYTGSAVLRGTLDGARKRGVTMVFCDLQAPVRAELKRDGLLDVIGEQHIYGDVDDVLDAYRKHAGDKHADHGHGDRGHGDHTQARPSGRATEKGV